MSKRLDQGRTTDTATARAAATTDAQPTGRRRGSNQWFGEGSVLGVFPRLPHSRGRRVVIVGSVAAGLLAACGPLNGETKKAEPVDAATVEKGVKELQTKIDAAYKVSQEKHASNIKITGRKEGDTTMVINKRTLVDPGNIESYMTYSASVTVIGDKVTALTISEYGTVKTPSGDSSIIDAIKATYTYTREGDNWRFEKEQETDPLGPGIGGTTANGSLAKEVYERELNHAKNVANFLTAESIVKSK